jgi:hypothetical protein
MIGLGAVASKGEPTPERKAGSPMSQPYRKPTARDLRAHELLPAIVAVLRAADAPLTIAEIADKIPGARHYDVKAGLFKLRRRGLAHGRKVWLWGSSPKAKRPVAITRLDEEPAA